MERNFGCWTIIENFLRYIFFVVIRGSHWGWRGRGRNEKLIKEELKIKSVQVIKLYCCYYYMFWTIKKILFWSAALLGQKEVSLIAREIESERNFAWNTIHLCHRNSIPILLQRFQGPFVLHHGYFKTKKSEKAVKKSGYGREIAQNPPIFPFLLPYFFLLSFCSTQFHESPQKKRRKTNMRLSLTFESRKKFNWISSSVKMSINDPPSSNDRIFKL